MGNNKTMLGILIVLIAIIIGGYMLYGNLIKETAKAPEREIVEEEITEEEEETDIEADEQKLEISATYDSKIVYTTDALSTDIYEEDCKKRGWEFNECGSPCGPDAEFCMTVCAYTCEKPAVKSESYTDILLGISFEYPNDMKLDDRDGSLRVYKWGPSQAEGTELYDGIVVSFMKADNPDNLELADFVNAELENELAFEAEVVKPVTETVHGGLNGYEYTTISLGKSTSFYASNSAGEIIRISYFVEDPLNEGFEDILNGILESLRYI